jgi:hypothetical protein
MPVIFKMLISVIILIPISGWTYSFLESKKSQKISGISKELIRILDYITADFDVWENFEIYL